MILVTFINRYAGILVTSENSEYILIAALYIHKFYINTRYHYITGNRIAEVHHVGDHFLLFGFDNTVFMTDIDDCQKLIFCHGLGLCIRINAHQAHHTMGKVIDNKYDRCQNTGQPVDNNRITKGHLLGIDGGCRLRCDLTEDQNQNSQDTGCKSNKGSCVGTGSELCGHLSGQHGR